MAWRLQMRPLAGAVFLSDFGRHALCGRCRLSRFRGKGSSAVFDQWSDPLPTPRGRARFGRHHRGGISRQFSSLDGARLGAACRVVALHIEDPIRRRLLELGMVPGALVHVIRDAPLFDPLEVRIGATRVAVRRSEASAIEVADVGTAD